jgi:hypothetical protein
MLNIKNIEKIIKVSGCSVQIKKVEMTDRWHPQRTYDMVFEHMDRPGREFFLSIDREGAHRHMRDEKDYPVFFWELTGGHNQSIDVAIWEHNLQSPNLFLGFIDNLINNYTT